MAERRKAGRCPQQGRPAQRCPGCCSRDGIAGARTPRARDEHAESRGVDQMRTQLKPGETAVFVGSSGVGKSSLLNCLLGDPTHVVCDIRADGKGRHTTTSRQLVLIPGGAVAIDTPGLRELTLWHAEDGLDRSFAD